MLCCLMAGLFAKQVCSTHVIGGDIYYECLNPAIGSYLFTVKLYRDCFTGVPPFDDPIFVSIYIRDSLGNDTTLYTMMAMSLPPSDTLENNTYNPCFSAPPDICVEAAVYQSQLILPPGTYHLTYQRCCRTQGILNIPNPQSVGFGFDIVVPDANLAVCNSSPAYNNYPPTILCLDEPFVYDHSATDPDGDSLVYYLCAPNDYDHLTWGFVPNPSGPPSSNETMNYISPFDSLYPITAAVDSFKIDPVTGLLTGTPTQAGRYVVAVCCSEYRNGVLLCTNSRDFQFNVAACLSDPLTYFSWAADTSDPCMMNFTYGGNSVASYSWDFGVDTLSTDTSSLEDPSYIFPDSGTYTVSLIVNAAVCPDTFEVSLSISGCPFVSVSEQRATQQLQAYPNPGSGTFTLNFGAKDYKGELEIQVYHMDGRQIIKRNMVSASAKNRYTLNLNGVSKGIYLLKVETGKEILTKRLIVL